MKKISNTLLIIMAIALAVVTIGDILSKFNNLGKQIITERENTVDVVNDIDD